MRTPLDSLLGTPGQTPECRTITDDISVHWFALGAERCLCGQTEHRDDDDEDQAAPDA
jgi:hypothetical protein